jgi:hypothetical protein
MDLISSPKTRAELPVTFAWLADTAIAKANKLQEKVGRLRVINDLVSEAEKKAGSPQIRPGANNVEKRFVRDGFDDYEYNESQISTECLTLQSKTSSLQHKVMKTKFQMQSLNSHIQQAEKRIKHFEHLSDENFSRSEEGSAKIKEVSSLILGESKRHEDLKKQIFAIQTEIRKCRWRKAFVRTKMEMYERRAGDEQKAMEDTVGECEEVYSSHADEIALCETKERTVKNVLGTLAQNKKRKTVLQNKISVSRKEYDLLLKEVSSIKRKEQGLQMSLTSTKKGLTAVHNSNSHSDTKHSLKIKSLQSDLDEFIKTIKSAESETAKREHELLALNEMSEESREKCLSFERMADGLVQDIESLKEVNLGLLERRESLESAIMRGKTSETETCEIEDRNTAKAQALNENCKAAISAINLERGRVHELMTEAKHSKKEMTRLLASEKRAIQKREEILANVRKLDDQIRKQVTLYASEQNSIALEPFSASSSQPSLEDKLETAKISVEELKVNLKRAIENKAALENSRMESTDLLQKQIQRNKQNVSKKELASRNHKELIATTQRLNDEISKLTKNLSLSKVSLKNFKSDADKRKSASSSVGDDDAESNKYRLETERLNEVSGNNKHESNLVRGFALEQAKQICYTSIKLSKLSHAAIDAMIDCSKMVRYPANATIIQQGEFGRKVFIIAAGEVALARKERDGSEHLLVTRVAGEYFGEFCLFNADIPRTASAVTKQPSLLIVMDKLEYEKLNKLFHETFEGVFLVPTSVNQRSRSRASTRSAFSPRHSRKYSRVTKAPSIG